MNTLFPLVLIAIGPGQPPTASLRVANPAADKGTVMSGPVLAHTFEVTHVGQMGIVALTGIEAGCGCLKADATPRLLNPGETSKITLTVNTLTQPEGPVTWTGTVRYSVDGGPEQELPLKLTAKLVRDVAVTPPMLAVSTAGAVRQVITIRDRRAKPLTVTRAVTTNRAFAVEVKAAKDGMQEVILTAGTELPSGSHEDTLTLITSDPACPELLVPVRVRKRAVGELTAIPDALTIRLNAARPETSAAALIRADGQPVRIQKAECDKAGVSVRHSEGSGPTATLRVIVNRTRAGAAGTAEVVVTLAEPPGKTVIVPVSWDMP